MAIGIHTDEQELLAHLRQGEIRAFDALYKLHSKPLLWKLRRMVKDPEEADELLQDLFVKVWEKRENINIQQSFQAYLYRVAQRMAIDYFRSLERRSRLHEDVQLRTSEYVHNTEENIIARETQDLINAAIALLPEQRRKAFTLCKLEGKSHAEAAEIMNISPNTVHNHLVKALSFVKDYVEKSGKVLSPLALVLVLSQM